MWWQKSLLKVTFEKCQFFFEINGKSALKICKLSKLWRFVMLVFRLLRRSGGQWHWRSGSVITEYTIFMLCEQWRVKSGYIFAFVTIKPHSTLSKRSVEIQTREKLNGFWAWFQDCCKATGVSSRGTWLCSREWEFRQGLSRGREKRAMEK